MPKVKPTPGGGKAGRQAAYQGKSGNLGKLWKTAKEKVATSPSPFINVDDGPYAAFLKKCECLHDDQDRLVVDFGFLVAQGDNEGKRISRRTYLQTEQNFEFFQRDLARLEVDLADLNIENEKDLTELCKELQKAKLLVRLRLKTGDAGYQNVFFQKLLERDAEEPAEAAKDDAGTEAAAGEDAGEAAGDGTPEEQMQAWVGKMAAFKQGKTVFTGKVTKVDVDLEKFTMKTNEGKVVVGDIETLEEVADGDGGGEEPVEAAAEGDEAELQVEDTVEFDVKGKTLSGKVIRIADDGTSAKVLVVTKTGKVKMDVKVEEMVILK
jgi:hypothetical protein